GGIYFTLYGDPPVLHSFLHDALPISASTEARARSWPKKLFRGLIRLVDAGIFSRFGICVSWVDVNRVWSRVFLISLCSNAEISKSERIFCGVVLVLLAIEELI